jgi:hypothetical protein
MSTPRPTVDDMRAWVADQLAGRVLVAVEGDNSAPFRGLALRFLDDARYPERQRLLRAAVAHLRDVAAGAAPSAWLSRRLYDHMIEAELKRNPRGSARFRSQAPGDDVDGAADMSPAQDDA